MRTRTTKSALVAAVMASTLLGSSAVLADGGRHHDSWRDSGHHRDSGHRIDYGRHHGGRHRGHHRYGDRDYTVSRNYYHGHPGHVTRYYSYDDRGDDDLLIGLAIGGLIGYAIDHADNGY